MECNSGTRVRQDGDTDLWPAPGEEARVTATVNGLQFPVNLASALPSSKGERFAHTPVQSRQAIFRLANVYRISCGEAPSACGQSGTSLAATNDIVGGRDLQAA